MAAGHASAAIRTELLRGLLDRVGASPRAQASGSLRLVAVASLETSPELPSDLREEIQREARNILPPKTIGAARSLSRAGPFALDLLLSVRPNTIPQKTATIRAIAEIGAPEGFPLLANLGASTHPAVIKELLRAWPRFDIEAYARRVLHASPLLEGALEVDHPRMTAGLSYLTKLTTLDCTYSRSDIGLAFVTALPNLRELHSADGNINDLTPLAKSRLQYLQIYGSNRPEAPALDLGPLSTIRKLENVRVWTRRVNNVAALARLPRLSRLCLNFVEHVNTLTDLQALSRLDSLHVGHIDDLVDLEPLNFLRGPSSLGLTKSPIRSESLRSLRRWATTLRVLRLDQLDEIDLGALSGLFRLRTLDLSGTRVRNVAALLALPALEDLRIDAAQADLQAIHSATNLSQLGLYGAQEIDLAPLAGATGLTINVSAGAVVRGADRLGVGSKILRW
jgi:Leucine-rich repeat (LRR) protein